VKRIFLTGFMGAGKTTVGRLLAASLGWDFLDLDQEIVETAGVSIPEIFALQGELVFRSMETEALRRVLLRERVVVSTGGGIVTVPLNRSLMRRSGSVINLRVTLEDVLQRLADDNSRPLLSGENRSAKITTLLAERAAGYADADLVVNTGGRNPDAIVKDICAWIQQQDR
jgi:shikimate kinase